MIPRRLGKKGEYPLIFINDARLFPSPPGANAPQILTRLTGPHEMAHYLARFEGECFGPFLERCYDAGEHSSPPANSTLLNPGVPGEPEVDRPLYIPGNKNNPFTERGQIYDRVIRGHWNLP